MSIHIFPTRHVTAVYLSAIGMTVYDFANTQKDMEAYMFIMLIYYFPGSFPQPSWNIH
uniref:Uncharacterized protein n=1 Tax=Rhizophora mucronata TaxID=61149 RepID=A0A2P2PSK2_RHIMU